MKALSQICILIFLLTISCEELTQNSDPIEQKPRFILHAGDAVSDSVNYYEFEPYLIIKGHRNGDENNYFYHDSAQLDLNINGQYDLFFEYYMFYEEYECDTSLSNDSVVVDCFPDADAFCWIKTNENVEIAVDHFDYFGLLPKKFGTGDEIISNLNWSSMINKNRFSYPGSGDNWDTDEYTKFMGFRICESSDTIYGWIRLNTHYSSRIEIYDYAIEK
ncbi:MAG: hypothetical protein WDZ80_02215 [Candidatus Paceibacterota bacterium]